MLNSLYFAAAQHQQVSINWAGIQNFFSHLILPAVMIAGLAIVFMARSGNVHKATTTMGITILGLLVFAVGAGGTAIDLAESFLHVFFS